MYFKRVILVFLFVAVAMEMNLSLAGVELPNGNFNQGAAGLVPGWRLTGGQSEWREDGGSDKSGALLIKGSHDGKGSALCRSDSLKFKPGGVYGIRFKARSEKAAGGTVTSGSDFANVDIGIPGAEWREFSYCFATPLVVGDDHYVKFGLWQCSGDFFFDDTELFEVDPVYNHENGVTLGGGEVIDGNRYSFNSDFGGYNRNHSRVLAGATAHFNSQRWCLGGGDVVDYLHELAGHKFLNASIAVDCGYYQKGGVDVLVSRDFKNWSSLGVIRALGSQTFNVPDKLLPAKQLYVRFAGQKEGCNLQVYGYRVNAVIDGVPSQIHGDTRYVEKVKLSDEVPVTVEALQFDGERQSGVVELSVENKSGAAFSRLVKLSCINKNHQKRQEFTSELALAQEGTSLIRIPFHLSASGEWQVEISIDDFYRSRCVVLIPSFYDSSYGSLLPSRDSGVTLWQASSGWKIPRGRRLPEQKSRELNIKLAANETEAVQLVLSPGRELRNVVLTSTALKCGDQVLPASSVQIDQVGYVPVTQPTDATGVIADWPDPLFAQRGGITLEKGMNQPYWIRVRVPAGVAAGIYRGQVEIAGEGVKERVPLCVEVFAFELPDRMTCETAFGMNHHRILRYHRVKQEDQRREVVDKYLKCLSDYHISPYDPAPLDSWKTRFSGLPAWRGGEYVKGTAHQGEWSYKVEDNNDSGNVNARYMSEIKVTGKPLKVCFSHKSSKAQRVLLTMNFNRADGSWISGNNRDMWVDGSTEWKREDIEVKSLPKEAAGFTLSLWGAGYYEGKSTIGTTWFDDIIISELESGKVLFDDGKFEEEQQLGDLSVEFDWDAWDQQMEKAFDEYHFNSFRCGLKGLGGGTFMERYEPQLEGVKESQPAYALLMEKYLKGVEAHLREKGWLEYAYIYWFDEPDPKDYEFVMHGFKKLEKYAPGLRRMLTEQVEPGLVGGPNLWCPLTPNLNVEGTEARRKAGDQFWWYVCCGPKAPYVTLFIDHPGVEMRLWLWQSWAERVTGILIWETAYWHSDCAYPDTLQNPYEDAMGWVNHVEKGERKPWGNGDGRFVYPPRSLCEGDGTQPVTDGPVPTLRLEMLRDGLEDYEYFVILKKLLADKGGEVDAFMREEYSGLLTVPSDVSEGLTSFNTDPAALEGHRIKIARAIEALKQQSRH